MNRIRLTKGESPFSWKAELVDHDGNTLGIIPFSACELKVSSSGSRRPSPPEETLTLHIPFPFLLMAVDGISKDFVRLVQEGELVVEKEPEPAIEPKP